MVSIFWIPNGGWLGFISDETEKLLMWRSLKRFLKRLPILRDPAKRRLLKRMPVVRQVKRAAEKTRRAYYRHFGRYWLTRKLSVSPRKRIVIGAGSRYDPGWIPTQRDFLELTEPRDWEHYFEANSVEAFLAEHVWEHITPEEGLAAASRCFRCLKPGGYLRVAVPDGLHPDPAYVELVKADAGAASPASGPDGNSANHKALYTYRTLKQLFERAGFRVALYEYFDEGGTFHCQDWDQTAGTIWRSKRFDPRNRGGNLASVYPGSLEDYLAYSSIILDAVKDPTPGRQEGEAREQLSKGQVGVANALSRH
jgi:predicted SAM-dependent methyltransferase